MIIKSGSLIFNHNYEYELTMIMNQMTQSPVTVLIATIPKFWDVIGYHQPDLSTYGTAYASSL